MSGTNEANAPTEKDPRRLKAYAYFRVHLSEIAAWIEGGCSVRSVWRAYAERASQPFPGSYSSFLRYCRKHKLGSAEAKPEARPLSEPTPTAVTSMGMPQPKRYPPPRTQPPGIVPNTEDLEL